MATEHEEIELEVGSSYAQLLNSTPKKGLSPEASLALHKKVGASASATKQARLAPSRREKEKCFEANCRRQLELVAQGVRPGCWLSTKKGFGQMLKFNPARGAVLIVKTHTHSRQNIK